jgi:hypothetical protein
MKASPLARALFVAFVILFIFAGSYLLLDSLGLWERLPAGLTRGLAILSGLILLATLLGHLVLTIGRLPTETVGRR